MPRRRRPAGDPYEDDPPDPLDFESAVMPTTIRLPQGPEGVVGFRGKPKPKTGGLSKRKAKT